MPELINNIFAKDAHSVEWHEARRRGVGGSDAAAILGFNQWRGILDVYNAKLGLVDNSAGSEAAYWGSVLEDVVAKTFAKITGLEVRRRNKPVFSKKFPFMLANIDREIVGKNLGLECKTANEFKRGEWSGDNLPDAYYCQVQHYISVMDWEACYIACLIGGQHFDYKLVARNDNFINNVLIPAEKNFWDCVINRTPPAPNAFDHVEFAQANNNLLAPDDEDFALGKRIFDLDADIKNLSERREACVNALKLKIGEAAGIDGVATFKQAKSSVKVDWKSAAREAGASDEIIKKFSVETPGARRFLLKFKPGV